MTPEEHRAFWRNVQFTVDKDVVRTDRSNQFFRGEGNPNVESMRYRLPGQQGSFPTGFHSHLPPRSLTSPLRSQLTLWEVDQPQKLLQGSRIFLLGSVPQNQRVLSYFNNVNGPLIVLVTQGRPEAPPKGTSKGPTPWASTKPVAWPTPAVNPPPPSVSLPLGGPLGDQATQGLRLASLTFCCLLANNCTKLAAHKKKSLLAHPLSQAVDH